MKNMEDATPSHYEQTEDTEIPYPNTVLRVITR
ncbi:hypothetical protein YALI2_A00543g [Yarrowia lipolytica]|nr:hypothetical protein YALI2_A00543g [Yarrowia lipolytica]